MLPSNVCICSCKKLTSGNVEVWFSTDSNIEFDENGIPKEPEFTETLDGLLLNPDHFKWSTFSPKWKNYKIIITGANISINDNFMTLEKDDKNFVAKPSTSYYDLVRELPKFKVEILSEHEVTREWLKTNLDRIIGYVK